MQRTLFITEAAERDARSNHTWWSENHSAEQANRWLEGIYATMFDLAMSADRQPGAMEASLRHEGFRQAHFGLGRKPSHRVIFRIEDHTVVIYRVRAFKQDFIREEDLDG